MSVEQPDYMNLDTPESRNFSQTISLLVSWFPDFSLWLSR